MWKLRLMMAKFILKALKNAEVYDSGYFVSESQVTDHLLPHFVNQVTHYLLLHLVSQVTHYLLLHLVSQVTHYLLLHLVKL